MSYQRESYNSYGGGYGNFNEEGERWGAPPQGPPPGGDPYGPPSGPPPGVRIGEGDMGRNRGMNQPPENDYPQSSYYSRSGSGARDDRSGYIREESYGGRTEDSYGGRREESYENRREESYGGRREESYENRREDNYGGRREDNYGGRREDNYGGRREESYENRREDSYGGRRNDDYNSPPHKNTSYGREDNEYSGREENKYGREENSYRREEKYGREESKYGREENVYDREENKYRREENSYGREESKYGREESSYENEYGKHHKNKHQGSPKRDDEYNDTPTSGYNRPYNNGAAQGAYGGSREDENGPESQYGRPNTNNRPDQYSNNSGYGGNNGNNGNNNAGNGGNIPYGGSESHFTAPPNKPQSFGVEGYQFQYSACTGRRKALLIGINYIGSKHALKGCINDVKNIKQFLLQHGYKEEDMVILTDDLAPESQPTRANMLRGMQWLIKEAKPDDSYFFHYSGHGGLTEDLNGDEESGFDDVIYPLDFEQAGSIIDDDIHDIMVRPLPQGARLTALFDCCNSGTALDLPYFYSTKGLLKEPNLLKEASAGLLSAYKSYTSGDIDGVVSQVTNLFNRVSIGKDGYEAAKKTKTSPSDVIMFSGCKDDQTSADTFADGQATGAMSHAFVKIMTQTPNQSYLTLLQNLRKLLEEGNYSQKPQLSSSHPIDVNLKFIF